MGKIIRFASSLGVAIAVLSLIALFSILGTMIPQHQSEQWYLERYPNSGSIILTLDLDNAYRSPIFSVLLGIFMVNLSLCTAKTLPSQAKQARTSWNPVLVDAKSEPIACTEEQCRTVLAKMRFHVLPTEHGWIASKYRWGVFGSSITHLGIIIVFAGGLLGNLLAFEGTVNLLPGQEISFDEKGFAMRLDDFALSFNQDGSIKQYTSTLTFTDDNQLTQTVGMWVNNPASHKDMRFYQASFGWTGNLRIASLQTGATLVEGALKPGQRYFHQDSHLHVLLHGYFPDMVIGHDQQPASISQQENNPYFTVVLYEFGSPVGSYILAPGETIPYKDVEISFTKAQAYTGILFRTDPSYPIVMAGFVVIMIGMLASFYLYPRFVRYSDSLLTTWSRKNGWVLHQMVSQAIRRQNVQNRKKNKE